MSSFSYYYKVLTLFVFFVVYIFTPSSKNVVYKKQKIFGKNNENTSILWALFAPKSDHKNESNSSWLDNSTIYLLTNQQVIFLKFLLKYKYIYLYILLIIVGTFEI